MLSVVSFTVSIISFCLTFLTVIFTYRFNRITIRNSAKQEHQKMLLDIDKILITEPSLWTIYDNHNLNSTTVRTPELEAKKEALIFYYLNFFDVVYEFYNKHIIQNKNDKETWKAWKEYMDSFIRGSSQARSIIKRSKQWYESDLSAFYFSIIQDFEQIPETGN
jgi:hypothetical protein